MLSSVLDAIEIAEHMVGHLRDHQVGLLQSDQDGTPEWYRLQGAITALLQLVAELKGETLASVADAAGFEA